MRQLHPVGDERVLNFCVSCGALPETREHVPPKVFLDDPLPANLPVVGTCRRCNEGLSLDEEYLACLIECARIGTAEVESLVRPKVRRLLSAKPALRTRLAGSRAETSAGVEFAIEQERVERALVKLARGHAVHELHELQLDTPSRLDFAPLHVLAHEDRRRFEDPPAPEGWPEVGSRAMLRLAVPDPLGGPWLVVQPGQYRYLARADSAVTIQVVIGEYLGVAVAWE